MGRKPLKRLGLVGYAIIPLPVYTSLQRALPAVELVKADDIFLPLRFIKSEAELACMRRAYEISEIAPAAEHIPRAAVAVQPGKCRRHRRGRDMSMLAMRW